MSAAWSEQLDQVIDDCFPQMVEVRRHLHAHPEPSGQETETSRYLKHRLNEAGLRARLGPDECGVIVEPNTSTDRPRIALRADIDALWIQDDKQVEYRSQVSGIMHACGHDAHAATVFGAVMGLQAAAAAGVLPWPVPWRGIFQPAEETSKGARQMIKAGALDNVDAILSLHVDPAQEVGQIGLRTGALTASCDEMDIQIHGRGGHAARPHESLDPIAAAAQLISSLYLFVPRAVDTHDPVVLTIGQITGGLNPNVIPEQVCLRGTLRTLKVTVRERTKNHIRQLARGLAEASGTQIEVEFRDGPPAVVNERNLTELIRRVGSDLLGPEQISVIEQTSMGGEDFAHYLEQVPGCMFRLGCRSVAAGHAPLHSPLFDIDEQTMRIGAKIFARALVLWLDPDRKSPTLHNISP